MLRMGVPPEVVQSKLVASGLDPAIAGADPLQPLPGAVEKLVALKDDPLYGKFFRMQKVGLPRDVVKHKMQMEAAHAIALDLDPALPLPPASAPRLPGRRAAGPADPQRQRGRGVSASGSTGRRCPAIA